MTTEKPSRIPVPRFVTDRVRMCSREEAIFNHGWDLELDWWNSHIEGLPGGPIVVPNGITSGSGRIDRRLLFGLAAGAVEDESGESALRLLWPTMLWGSGWSRRNMKRRIASISDDPQRFAALLHQAAIASRTDSDAAFRILQPRRTAIRFLGPAFFTKFLYFAGGGEPSHPSFILDARVLRTLNAAAKCERPLFRNQFSFGPNTYAEAGIVLRDWADELTAVLQRPVAIDEVERAAFELNGPLKHDSD